LIKEMVASDLAANTEDVSRKAAKKATAQGEA